MEQPRPKASLLRNSVRIVAELLVVFFGAYAAFTLSNSNNDKKDTKDRIKFYQNFLSEMVILGERTHDLKREVSGYISNYEDSLNAGLKPPLKVHNNWTFTLNLFVTKAVFDDAYFSKVGKGDYLVSVDMGTSLIRSIEVELNNYRDNCQQLLYFSKYDNDRFYENGELLPEFRWYLNDLKRIDSLLARLIVAIEEGAVPSTQELIRLEER